MRLSRSVLMTLFAITLIRMIKVIFYSETIKVNLMNRLKPTSRAKRRRLPKLKLLNLKKKFSVLWMKAPLKIQHGKHLKRRKILLRRLY